MWVLVRGLQPMLMMIIVSILFTVLVSREIFKPMLQYTTWKKRRQYEEDLRFYQLQVIRSFYPVLNSMSSEEINEKYGINKVYQSVGRAYLKSRNPYQI